MQSMRQFLEDHPVTLEIVSGPDLERDGDGWEHYAYTVELAYDGRTMRSPWRQGTAITDDPDAASLLDSLASDAVGIENTGSFEEWAPEMGMDLDSRKAEATYRQCVELGEKLRELLGDDAFTTLLREVERS